jgi:hypothetical protein
MDDWKTITAIIGAITGTVSLAWNIITKIRESGRLHVRAEVTSSYEMGPNNKPKKIEGSLNVKVTNIGKNPVTLTNVIVLSGDETFSIRRKLGLSEKEEGVFSWMDRDMPQELQHGRFYFKAHPHAEKYTSFLRVQAVTSMGRVYSSSSADNKNVKKHVLRLNESLEKMNS